MANLLNYDLSSHFTRAFSQYPFVSSSSFEVNRSVRLNLRSCFVTSNGNGDVNSKRVFLKGKTKCLEKGISVIDGKCDATIVEHRSPGGSHNNTFCDQHFSQKLVVAVDIDEGLYLCMHMLIFVRRSQKIYKVRAKSQFCTEKSQFEQNIFSFSLN
jgi:hypothetical protein